ncbi:uncharacterized protein LOC135072143 [Ostrinia nubilalis]|uniref:uncharacterized protein LOC135072143 n=1 Tax=Ostrinia nubilalis TaxID=29057 RepID=UPI003082422D
MRSAFKEDLQSSPAELVYGETLRLPGQFLSPRDDYKTADVTQYATRLRAYMAKLTPRPTSWHATSSFYIPRDLQSSSHVFVRQDRLRTSLEPPYAGPFRVTKRQPKFYTLDINTKEVNVSIDRLKPAYATQDSREAEIPDANEENVRQTSSGRIVRYPDFYRP